MAQRTDIATVDELHASATKLTGLDDFGETLLELGEERGVLRPRVEQRDPRAGVALPTGRAWRHDGPV